MAIGHSENRTFKLDKRYKTIDEVLIAEPETNCVIDRISGISSCLAQYELLLRNVYGREETCNGFTFDMQVGIEPDVLKIFNPWKKATYINWIDPSIAYGKTIS